MQALGDLAAGVRAAVADGGFCYGYHGEVDLLGRLYGPGSSAWRMQLREVDRLVESLVEGLPPGRLIAVSLRRPTLADVFVHLTGRGLN